MDVVSDFLSPSCYEFLNDILTHFMGVRIGGSMRALFLPRNGWSCRLLLVLVERIEESQEKIMKRKSLGMVPWTVRISTYIVSWECRLYCPEHTFRSILALRLMRQ